MHSALYLLADKVLEGTLADRLRLYHQAGVSKRAASNLLAEDLGVQLDPVTVDRWTKAVVAA